MSFYTNVNRGIPMLQVIPQNTTYFLRSGLAERLRDGERRRSRLRLRLAFFARALDTIQNETNLKCKAGEAFYEGVLVAFANVRGRDGEANHS